MSSEHRGPLTRRAILIASILTLLAAVLLAAVTGQVWEDYYITFRSSRNLVEGHGLVYQPGERVHTFTSPLGVLLPALTYAITGSETGALWLFRLLAAGALAGAAALLGAAMREQQQSRAAFAFALAFSIFEAKTLSFAVNGMETAFMVFFTALSWREITRASDPRRVPLAVGFSGLMWTRPDACVLALALVVSWWLMEPRDRGSEARRWWRAVLAAAAIAAVAYAPWFIWAWTYYGSPIPNTILAKSALAPGFSLVRLLLTPWELIAGPSGFHGLFAPTYYVVSGWPPIWNIVCRVLASLAALLWLLPFLPRPTRAASFAVLLGGIYLHRIMPYPWYYPPWSFLAAAALGSCAFAVGRRARPGVASFARILGAALVAGMVAMGVAQAYTFKTQQEIIENEGRKRIGLWLRQNGEPTDTVFAEPIGYIGYYSGMKILDFPGLCAPEVSALVRQGHRSYETLIKELQPVWLVLRPVEIAEHRLREGTALNAYREIGFWNQLPRVQSAPFLPGRNWLGFDSQFLVFRRTDRTGIAP